MMNIQRFSDWRAYLKWVVIVGFLGLLVLSTFTAASTAANQESLPTPTLGATFTPTLQPTQADWLVNQGLVVS
ncbi:MAG: hypothetical protein K8I30_16920, partial [Anaerolineae bacterium]|nr:hypothetical protein [Anaerolineae bacterium]